MPEPLLIRFELLPHQAQLQSCPSRTSPEPAATASSRRQEGLHGAPRSRLERNSFHLSAFVFCLQVPSAHLAAPTAVETRPPSLCSPGASAVGSPIRCWSSKGNKGQ